METGLFATAACDIADGRNGRTTLAPLASTQIVAGREFRDAFGRMANALYNGREGDAIGALGDVAVYGVALNTMALKAVDSDNRYRRVSVELNSAKAANVAAAERSANLEARNATQSDTIRALTAELAEARANLETAVTERASAWRTAANNLESANALERRAEAAERQLAEYRAACAILPYGVARAYPAAHSLMRVYLADVESAEAPAAADRPCLVANTTRACYWRVGGAYVALGPDDMPTDGRGGYNRLDSLMRLKGESDATIARTCDASGHAIP